MYSKTCLKQPLKKNTKIGFQYQLSLNAGQKHCRMLQREHSAILSTFIMLQFSIKTFVLSILKWPLKTGFTVLHSFQVILLTYCNPVVSTIESDELARPMNLRISQFHISGPLLVCLHSIATK